tara:strand:- start:7293 stop:8165 length:873 start_codon:yes stop_codon:yes gene_type:complete
MDSSSQEFKVTITHNDLLKLDYFKGLSSGVFSESNKKIHDLDIDTKTWLLLFEYFYTKKINKNFLSSRTISDIDFLGFTEIEESVLSLPSLDLITTGIVSKEEVIIYNLKQHTNKLIFNYPEIRDFDYNTVEFLKTGDDKYIVKDGEYGFIHMLPILYEDEYKELFKKFINMDNIDINLKTKCGETGLIKYYYFVDDDSPIESLKLLLQNPDIDVNVIDNNGKSALTYAINNTRHNDDINYKRFKLLLTHPGLDFENESNKTALSDAYMYRIPKIHKLIEEHMPSTILEP